MKKKRKGRGAQNRISNSNVPQFLSPALFEQVEEETRNDLLKVPKHAPHTSFHGNI